jgi:hypothetical protein
MLPILVTMWRMLLICCLPSSNDVCHYLIGFHFACLVFIVCLPDQNVCLPYLLQSFQTLDGTWLITEEVNKYVISSLFFILLFLLDIFLIFISNVIPKVPYTLPPPCSGECQGQEAGVGGLVISSLKQQQSPESRWTKLSSLRHIHERPDQ